MNTVILEPAFGPVLIFGGGAGAFGDGFADLVTGLRRWLCIWAVQRAVQTGTIHTGLSIRDCPYGTVHTGTVHTGTILGKYLPLPGFGALDRGRRSELEAQLLIVACFRDAANEIVVSLLYIVAAINAIGVLAIAYEPVIGANDINDLRIGGIAFAFEPKRLEDRQVFRLIGLAVAGGKTFRGQAEFIVKMFFAQFFQDLAGTGHGVRRVVDLHLVF